MTESCDYEESVWSKRDDFRAARQFYDQNAGRSYSEATRTGRTNSDLLPRSLKSLRSCIFAIVGDVTGSMGDAPGVYFAKAPYVLHEARTEYLGPDTDLLLGAFGDANPPHPDKYPLQFQPFLPVTATVDQAKKAILSLITTEKGGGGQKMENSELAALYLCRNVSASRATQRICIIITDEAPYEVVDRKLATEVAFVELKRDLSTEELFEELKESWLVYVVQRPYDNGCGEEMDYDTAKINAKWVKLLGSDHVAYLPDINRLVDVIYGILGDATGKYDYFLGEITERQLKDAGGQKKIDDTFRALGQIHAKHVQADPGKPVSGQSTANVPLGGKRTKRLLDD